MRRDVAILEEIVTFLEVAPERNEFQLIPMRGCQRPEAGVCEACRENLDGQMRLSLTVD
jgi:hypothetical protein